MLEVLAHVNEATDTTTAVITHNAAIGRMGNRIVNMSSGEITSIETVAVPARPSEIEW